MAKKKMSSQMIEKKCPKCGGEMVNDVCTKCKYSPTTAMTKQEAKDYTHPG